MRCARVRSVVLRRLLRWISRWWRGGLCVGWCITFSVRVGASTAAEFLFLLRFLGEFALTAFKIVVGFGQFVILSMGIEREFTTLRDLARLPDFRGQVIVRAQRQRNECLCKNNQQRRPSTSKMWEIVPTNIGLCKRVSRNHGIVLCQLHRPARTTNAPLYFVQLNG